MESIRYGTVPYRFGTVSYDTVWYRMVPVPYRTESCVANKVKYLYETWWYRYSIAFIHACYFARGRLHIRRQVKITVGGAVQPQILIENNFRWIRYVGNTWLFFYRPSYTFWSLISCPEIAWSSTSRGQDCSREAKVLSRYTHSFSLPPEQGVKNIIFAS
jgi:hypothetical protein